jgi:alcohol dehydrogenase (cytochrome c)
MRPQRLLALVIAVAGLALAASTEAAPVTADDLRNPPPGEWLSYGRTYSNQCYSTLDAITPGNVGELKPVFAYSTGGRFAGLEATPLFHDGSLYFTGDYSRVFALDARTGTVRWYWEPEFDEAIDTVLCCGPVNRGVAIRGEKVYVGTLDARLVALSTKDGSVAWERTLEDWKTGYSATGAPLVVGDLVITGIGGAEYGVRGFIQAFDAETGGPRWKTYTIPGPGEPGNETWPGETWKTGGASTWQTGAYDAETNTLFWGTGNPGPWNSDLRTGDNKWSCSLLALDATTGAIKWGFQYTPNDAWDYDGNNAPVLLDVNIDGSPRKVLVQSNRNGFLYVLDRTDGSLIYATPTIDGINWTHGLDPITGRPNVNEATRARSGGERIEPIVPGLEGGTNWFPIAADPEKNIVYLNTNDWAMALTAWKPEDVKYTPGQAYMGVDYQMYRHKDETGHLKAFDVAAKKWLWDLPSPLPMFAGVLVTKGGLVFTGDQLGYFKAVDAGSGKELWKFQTGSGINASPITYELDGRQYVAILSGLGGDPSFYFSGPKGGMLWVFSVDGKVEDTTAMNPTLIEKMLPVYGR